MEKSFNKFIELYFEGDILKENLKNFRIDFREIMDKEEYQPFSKEEEAILKEIKNVIPAHEWIDFPKYLNKFYNTKKKVERRIRILKESEQRNIREIENEMNKYFKFYNFFEADKIFIDNEKEFSKININKEEYEKEKAEYIQLYFSKKLKVKVPPDLEQATSIGALGKNVLVSARAGSGKTQTISGKVSFLVNKYGIKKEEILVLCFNKSAAASMKEKIKELVPGFENAKTFHCWAMRILFSRDDDVENNDYQLKNSILVDEDGTKSEDNLENFLKKIIDESEDEFKDDFYEFLKTPPKESDIFKKNEKFYEEAYKKIRNHKKEKKFFPTLAGVNVRSLGEKWITDFLLENGIKYVTDKKNYSEYQENVFAYEKYFKPKNGEGWFPDFKITKNEKYIIWEHWAIDKNGNFIFKNYKEGYDSKREKIRKEGYEFEEDKNVANANKIFLETKSGYIRNFKGYKESKESRAEFEDYLAKKLINCGIELPNKAEKEIIKEKLKKVVWEREKEKGFDDFLSFMAYREKRGG